MGREIRRVPPDWEHPRYTEDNAPRRGMEGQYMRLFDNDFESAAEEWIENFKNYVPEERGTYRGPKYFWEYDYPPSKECHRERKWTEEEATAYQIYETVTEGTPVSPVFLHKGAMVEWLVSEGTSRKAAEEFVNDEWCPSMTLQAGEIKENYETLV